MVMFFVGGRMASTIVMLLLDLGADTEHRLHFVTEFRERLKGVARDLKVVETL